MLPRLLSIMLIALAMLAAPLTMSEGTAMAAPAPAAAPHHGEAAPMPAHCDEQGSPDTPAKAMGDNCCVATCVAVVAPAGAGDLPAYHPLVRRPTSDSARLGILAEIATPPPRTA
jgi:putative hemolysin